MSLLVLVWGLVACSPVQTPIAIATATIIPSTATSTARPIVATDIPPDTATPFSLITPTAVTLTPIIETQTEFDIDFTEVIMLSLANDLGVTINRVQLVSVESERWSGDDLGCIDVDDADINATAVSGFRYRLLVGTLVYDYHTEGTERFIQCSMPQIMQDEVLIAVDPLAEEILLVVQNLLANELDLSTRRIQLVTMQPVTWEDTSLGCPQDEQTYTEREISGYHIVVSVGNEQYIYHSDSNTAYPCSAEQSIIPVETDP
ncbi:MAG: hypothetical protein AAF846_19630 [Chloroflexota bacterium]